jgi:hypothetical protein
MQLSALFRDGWIAQSSVTVCTHKHTHTHTHTPANKQMLRVAFSNSCRYHTKRKSAERRRLHSWAVAWQRDATRLVSGAWWCILSAGSKFFRVSSSPRPPPTPLLFFTFSAPVSLPSKQNVLICYPNTVISAMVTMTVSNKNVKGLTRTKYVISMIIFTAVPCILMLSKSFIYQLMHNRVALIIIINYNNNNYYYYYYNFSKLK